MTRMERWSCRRYSRRPGVAFTATLKDIDNDLADLSGSAEWQWSRSTSKSDGWTDIDKATGSVYDTR